METFMLPRTGDSALKFNGELIAEQSTQSRQGPTESRWFELGVYLSEGGKYVVAIGYRSRWQGELDQDSAAILDEPVAVRDYLRDYDPCSPTLWMGQREEVHGAAARNEYNRNAIRNAYNAGVSELLAAEEFAEEIA